MRMRRCEWCNNQFEGGGVAGWPCCSKKCLNEYNASRESKNSGGGGCAGMLILIVSVSALLFMGIYNAIIA
jgi:hypothetical protein